MRPRAKNASCFPCFYNVECNPGGPLSGALGPPFDDVHIDQTIITRTDIHQQTRKITGIWGRNWGEGGVGARRCFTTGLTGYT